MGTMRMMDGPPAEEMAIAAVKSELKLMATSKTVSSVGQLRSKLSNGSQSLQSRFEAAAEEEAEVLDGNKSETDHHPAGDFPMDLSKRSVEEESGAGALSNGRQATDVSTDEQESVAVEEEEEEEPLNLSRHGGATGRWNSCPRLSHRPLTADSPNSTNLAPSCPPTDLLQKRVRLEEMVSYIRRCSVVEASRHRSATVGVPTVATSYRSELDDEDETCHLDSRAVKRSMSCSHLETTAVCHRRKSATTPPSKRARSGHPSNGEDLPKDLTTSCVPNGAGLVSYPVLRQQLLGADCRQLGLLQSAASRNLTKEEMEIDKSCDDREVDDDQDLQQQMRLLSTTGSAAPVARLPWTAYAYYANLFQELQGSLTGAVSPTSIVSLPLSLSLPLAIPASESHADSPMSGDDDEDSNAATGSSGISATAGATTVQTTVDCGSANSPGALFRKRAPRALTGKHVKHGTGASPATLLTLRQKIEQKRIQQQQLQNRLQQTSVTARLDRRTDVHGVLHKSLKGSAATAATVLKKKKVVS